MIHSARVARLRDEVEVERLLELWKLEHDGRADNEVSECASDDNKPTKVEIGACENIGVHDWIQSIIMYIAHFQSMRARFWFFDSNVLLSSTPSIMNYIHPHPQRNREKVREI